MYAAEQASTIEYIKDETKLSLSCYISSLFRHAISSLKMTSKTGRNVGFKNILTSENPGKNLCFYFLERSTLCSIAIFL